MNVDWDDFSLSPDSLTMGQSRLHYLISGRAPLVRIEQEMKQFNYDVHQCQLTGDQLDCVSLAICEYPDALPLLWPHCKIPKREYYHHLLKMETKKLHHKYRLVPRLIPKRIAQREQKLAKLLLLV